MCDPNCPTFHDFSELGNSELLQNCTGNESNCRASTSTPVSFETPIDAPISQNSRLRILNILEANGIVAGELVEGLK